MFLSRLSQWGRWLGIIIIAVLFSVLILQQQGIKTSAQGQGNGACASSQEFKHVQGIGKACRQANGLWKVQLANGSFAFTHGNDEHTHLAANTTTSSTSAVAAAAGSPVTCVGSGTYRSMVLYVNATDVANQYSTRLPTIRSQIQKMQDRLNNESMLFGVSTSYRMACDADGQVTVKNVPLSISSAQHDIGAVSDDIYAKGYHSSFEKYMVYYEQGSCGGGVGWMYLDDSTNINNPSNIGSNGGAGVAISWGMCDETFIMHESGHNMGAVQNSAPNTSGAGHCIDEQDIMCYNDGGPRGSQLHTVCSDSNHFDCNHDDYFNPSPAAGSYLATHWNIGDCRNRFLNRSGCGSTIPTNTPKPATPIPTPIPSATPTGATNLARGKATANSSTCATGEEAAKAVDGSTTTKWCGFLSGGSVWMAVDLGTSYGLTSFIVRHAGAGGESTAWNTKDFQIQVSSDNANWIVVSSVTGNTASVTTHNISTRNARYVRLWITAPEGTVGTNAARIYEFEVYGGAVVNLARGKGTASLNTCASTESAAMAVDGSTTNNSKWCGFLSGGSVWMAIDLGSNYGLTSFTIKHAGAGGESTSWNTRDFQIQTSTDNANWTTVSTVTGNTASITTHPITSRLARYVRLWITVPGADSAARIYEVEAY